MYLPLGPAFLQQVFIDKIMAHKMPGVYLIFDALAERFAYMHALKLERDGIIHPGFDSDKDRLNFIQKGLETYDKKYHTSAYTYWLPRQLQSQTLYR